jgi:alpha-galactosidase
MSIKVSFIGAGSVGFTRTLVRDLLSVPEFQDAHFAMHDINDRNMGMTAQILEKDIAGNSLPARITQHSDRRQALEGAQYVVNCTRIGGLEAFRSDIEIPLKYGVDQCVGDTLCAGGIMYGQRNIPQILAFQKDMKEVAADGCLFLNYANPMAMNTWAALEAQQRGDGVATIGLCHGIEGGWTLIDRALAHMHGDETIEDGDWANLHQRTEIICIGINHQTWYTRVRYKGRPVHGTELLEAFLAHPEISQTEKVRIDVLRRFGYFSTESNGHLSEYLPWYRKRFAEHPEEAERWIDLSKWIHGETGGYLRVCTEGRNWFETDFPKWLAEAGKPLSEYRRSSEHGSHIIEAHQTGRVYRGHFNVQNRGVIRNLPEDSIIEAPGFVDHFGINMVSGFELPAACAATCRASIDVQRMAKDAAVSGDVTVLKQAMLHDPLVGAVCDPEQIWQMTDEMLVAQREWLPQYERNGAIDKAAERLAEHERRGTRVSVRTWRGAASVEVRTVEQLRAAKDASVMEADKAAAHDSRDSGNST